MGVKNQETAHVSSLSLPALRLGTYLDIHGTLYCTAEQQEFQMVVYLQSFHDDHCLLLSYVLPQSSSTEHRRNCTWKAMIELPPWYPSEGHSVSCVLQIYYA